MEKHIYLNGASVRKVAYENGLVLKEVRNDTITFKLFGRYYSTSNNRARKGRHYSFKQMSWRVLPMYGIVYKLFAILTKRVKRIKCENTHPSTPNP